VRDDLDVLDFLESAIAPGIDVVGCDQILVFQELEIMSEASFLVFIHGFSQIARGNDPKATKLGKQFHFFGTNLEAKITGRKTVSPDAPLDISGSF
jgi:hypothetical protein